MTSPLYHECLCESCGELFQSSGEGRKSQPEPYCPQCSFEHCCRVYEVFDELPPHRLAQLVDRGAA